MRKLDRMIGDHRPALRRADTLAWAEVAERALRAIALVCALLIVLGALGLARAAPAAL